MTLTSVPNFRSCLGLVSEKFSTIWNRFSVRDCGWFTALPKLPEGRATAGVPMGLYADGSLLLNRWLAWKRNSFSAVFDSTSVSLTTPS